MKNRYVTRGVIESIPIEVQRFLWNVIDNLYTASKVEMDYLQIFELSSSESGGQRIIHKQEVPEYQAVYEFDKVKTPIHAKVYVIDDVEYCTMLLPEER